jgi:hypothetical protein
MKLVSILFTFILVVALLAVAGCTSTPSNGGTPTAVGTSNPATGTSSGPSGVTGAGNLVPSPTDTVADYNMVTVDVGEKDYLGSIPVIFQGGMGQIHVTKIDVTLYTADGQTITQTLGIKKGDEVDLKGTKQTDRVVVYVTFDNGQRLKTNDAMSAYRTRL